MQVGLGFWASKTLLSAVEMELFTELARHPATGEALRDRLGLHPRSSQDFLDALVALGFLDRHDGVYRNTPSTDLFLDKHKPRTSAGSWRSPPAPADICVLATLRPQGPSRRGLLLGSGVRYDPTHTGRATGPLKDLLKCGRQALLRQWAKGPICRRVAAYGYSSSRSPTRRANPRTAQRHVRAASLARSLSFDEKDASMGRPSPAVAQPHRGLWRDCTHGPRNRRERWPNMRRTRKGYPAESLFRQTLRAAQRVDHAL